MLDTNMISDQLPILELTTELNNIGVHLLQGGAHKRAMKTFMFAMDFMAHAVDSRPVSERLASQCLIQAEAWLQEVDCDKINVYMYDSINGFQEFRGSPSSPSIEMSDPILFNTFQGKAKLQHQDVTTSILFYNVALAHIRSYDQCYVEKQSSCTFGTVNLLEMSLDFITDEECSAAYEHKKFLATLVLNELMDLQVELGMHDEANTSLQWLVRLDELFDKDKEPLQAYDSIIFMPPAA